MKKYTLAILSLCILLISGCNPGNQSSAPSGAGNNSVDSSADISSYSSNIPVLTAENTRLIFDPSDEKWDGFDYGVSYFGFSGDNFFLLKSENDLAVKEALSAVSRYYSYNLGTDELQELGELANPTAASGSVVLMHGGLYAYEVESTAGEEWGEISFNKFLKFDAKNNKMTVLEESEENFVSSFVYFSKLSEDEFITFHLRQDSSPSGAASAIIKRYDVNTNKGEEITKERYEFQYNSTCDIVAGSGTVLERACAMDGKIYAVARKYNGTDLSNFINIYNRDGELEKSFSIDEVKGIYEESTTLGFYVIGDYFLFRNWNNDCAIYRLKNEKLAEVIPVSERIQFVSAGMENFFESKNHPYIFFTHVPDENGGRVDSYLFALECATGVITKIDVAIDEKYNCITGVYVDEYGNMVLKLSVDFLDNAFDAREYYIRSETITKLLQS